MSYLLAILVGVILLFGVVYTINVVYIDIIDFVGNAAKYKKLDLKTDESSA